MRFKSNLWSFVRDEDGATVIEYALIAGIVAIGIIAALTNAGTALVAVFQNVSAGFESILN